MISRNLILQIRNYSLKTPFNMVALEVEPKFEDDKQYPEYPIINIRLQGYDYQPLENFQIYIKNMAKQMKFKHIESYAMPAQTNKVTNIMPGATTVDEEVTLNYYERVVRLGDVGVTRVPIFAMLLQANAPPGVKITIKEHSRQDEEARFVPDWTLIAKKKELELMDNPVFRRAEGWDQTQTDQPQQQGSKPKPMR